MHAKGNAGNGALLVALESRAGEIVNRRRVSAGMIPAPLIRLYPIGGGREPRVERFEKAQNE